MFGFLKKGTPTIDYIVMQAKLLRESSETFLALVDSPAQGTTYAKRLAELEHQADQVVHKVAPELRKVFMTDMLEKDEFAMLVELLDDIIDDIEETADRIVRFKIATSSPELKGFAQLIAQAADRICQGILLLQAKQYRSPEYAACYQAIHSLENEGDKLHRNTIAMLDEDSVTDVRTLIRALKWMQVYQILENALDKCEDMAIALEHIETRLSL